MICRKNPDPKVPRAARRTRRSSRRRRAALAACLLAGTLAGCSPEAADRSRDPRPNVIVIVLDTVRADHLGAYGYARQTTPRIDAFAAEAVRYARAMSTAPWTVPSHASLFTGLYPFEHGAHSYEVADPAQNNVGPLALEHLTLAEALLAEGYATGAFVANVAYLSPWTQLNQGFQTYHAALADSTTLNRAVRPWLERNRNQAFFLFMNYLDAHRPYNARPREGLLDRPVAPDGGALLDRLIEATLAGVDPPPPELVSGVIDQYDTALANLDEQVGVLLDWLRELNLYRNSVIVITSDHGEYFGEHGLVEHSKDVYQPALAIPLIVRAPGDAAPRVDDTLVSLAMTPWIIWQHMAADVRARRASSFLNAPGGPVLAENYFSRTKDVFDPRWGSRFRRVRTAWFEWPYKFIRSSDGAHELYDLSRDAGETNNLVGSDAGRAAAMQAALDAFERSRPRRAPQRMESGALSAEQLRVLEQLGYAGSAQDGEQP